jgi:hypothetical protein
VTPLSPVPLPPSRTSASARFDAVAPWTVGVLLALPIVLFRYPPMRDLPLHEAIVGVLRHFDDAGTFPPGLYVHNFGRANQLFYLLAWVLSAVVPVPTACKFVSALAIAALPPAVGHLARHLGRPAWLGLLAGPVMLGWLFFWGVVANMLGLVLLVVALPALDRWIAKPSPAAGAKTFAVLLVLDLAHEQMMAVAFGFVLLGVALDGPRRQWPNLVALGALVVAAFADLHTQESLRNSENLAAKAAFASLAHKLVIAPGMLFPGQPPSIRAFAWTLEGIPIVWLVARRLRRWRMTRASRTPSAAPFASPASRRSQDRGWRATLLRERFGLLAAFAVLIYLTFPNDLHGAHLLYHRFLPVAFVLALVLVAPRDDEGPGLLRIVALAGPIGALVVVMPSLVECDELYRDYDALLSHVEPGSAVVNVDLDALPNDLLRGIDLQGHAVAVKGGRSFFDYTQSPLSPALLAPSLRWDESTRRLLRADLRPSWDLHLYRYLFVHGGPPVTSEALSSALLPEARLIDSAGEWFLFESTLPVVPPASPEPLAPVALGESLGARLQKALARPRGESGDGRTTPAALERGSVDLR